ncbi:MAG TPA: PilZ domain-containing protein, partial [Blastocatellia bacterium]
EAATKARDIESGQHFLIGSREKRRQERYQLRLPAIVISEERQWQEQTETLDVSKSGIRFSLARPVDWCSILRVQLPLPSELRLRYQDRGTFSAHAMVCRCEESQGTHMIAAEFGMARESLTD